MDPIDISIALSIFVGSSGAVAIALMAMRVLLGRWSVPRLKANDEEIRELHEAVGRLSAETADLHERLDFTERVLAAQRTPERMEGGER